MRNVLCGLTFLSVSCANAVADAPHPPTKASQAPKVSSEPVPAPTIAPDPPKVRKRWSRSEAEWYTKIAVSEGNFSEPDAEGILQTLENMRGPKDSLLDAMYRQSPHITRREPFVDPRQIWVSYLPMKGKAPPEKGWIECTGKDPLTKRPAPEHCTGTWDSTVDTWTAFRTFTKRLYYSGVLPTRVDGKPIQWGGDMDYWRGVDHGLCPLKSVGTKNTFWGLPNENVGKCLPIETAKVERSRVLTASIASGRAKKRHLISQRIGETDESTGTD